MSSSSEKRKFIDCVSVGTPAKKIAKKCELIKVVIHKFQNLTEQKGQGITSRIFKAHGYDWYLGIYPRGDYHKQNDDTFVSLRLHCFNANKTGKPSAKFSLRCKDYKRKSAIREFKHSNSFGWSEYRRRSDIIENYLEDDGSLIVEVGIQIAEESRRIWYPKELQRQSLLIDLYNGASSETADVIFIVEGREYYAHKNVLGLCAKMLLELSKDSKIIHIPYIKKETFQKLLEFMYTVKVPDIKDSSSATELLLAADKYDHIHLKLYVESVIADKFITVENTANMLIIGDAHSCALLKETAINMFLSNSDAVMKSEGWSKVQESTRILTELLGKLSDQLALKNNPSTNIDNIDDINKMDVITLRENLTEANLDVDGSREILIKRLRDYKGE